jgi:hypothetical protein
VNTLSPELPSASKWRGCDAHWTRLSADAPLGTPIGQYSSASGCSSRPWRPHPAGGPVPGKRCLAGSVSDGQSSDRLLESAPHRRWKNGRGVKGFCGRNWGLPHPRSCRYPRTPCRSDPLAAPGGRCGKAQVWILPLFPRGRACGQRVVSSSATQGFERRPDHGPKKRAGLPRRVVA